MSLASSLGRFALSALLVTATGLAAAAPDTHAPIHASETHGKVPVKLVKAFVVRIPTGTSGVAWSPDGSVLGVSSNYGMHLSTYDNSGHLLHEFEGRGNHGAYTNSFAFIHGASQVLFPVESGAPYEAAGDIRDVTTGRILQTILRAQNVIHANYFAVTPDQKRFAIANGTGPVAVIYSVDGAGSWHEAAVTQPKRNGYPWFYVVSLGFSPDGKAIAVGQDDGRFIVADSTTGKTLRSFQIYDAPGVADNVDSVAVSPNGEYVFAGMTGVAESPKATPEGLIWASSGQDMATVWRVRDGRKLASFTDQHNGISQVAWDPKDRFVVFADYEGLVLWRPLAEGENFTRFRLPYQILSLAISRDGKYLAIAVGDAAIVFTIENQ